MKEPLALTREAQERWLRDPLTILADVEAAMGPKRRQGDPLPMWHLVRLQEGNRRWREAKRSAASKRAMERLKEQNRTKHAGQIAQGGLARRMLEPMEPGQWYGLKALGRALGVSPAEAGRLGQTLRQRAWVTRLANPKWDPNDWQGGANREPKWLYRLTPAGEAERDRQLMRSVLG